MYGTINSRDRLSQLCRLLFSSHRQPLLVITSSLVKGRRDGPIYPLPAIQEAVAPHAKALWVTGGMVSDFNRAMAEHGIRPSGIRLYLDGINLNESSAKHRLWLESALLRDGMTVDEFCNEVRDMLVNYQPPSQNRKLARNAMLTALPVKTVSSPTLVSREGRRAKLTLRHSSNITRDS